MRDTLAVVRSSGSRHMAETDLEMAERHVREGELRIGRQRELAARLRRQGHFDAAEAAYALVVLFAATLREFRTHLREMLRKI